jgi:hypothetical protein
MAAYAYSLPIIFLDIDLVTGNVRVQCNYVVGDPAMQGDGSGHDATVHTAIAFLDPTDPFSWDKTIETAIIDDAGALTTPFTVSVARCFTQVLSDQIIKANHTYNVPVTGFDLTINNNVRELILNPAGTLATGTITMPGSPQNGRKVRIMSSQEVTALTLSPNTGQTILGAITIIPANGFVEYSYRKSIDTWFRAG